MKKGILLFSFWLMLAWQANGQITESKRKKEFNLDKNGVAIQGYDPVSYFTVHKAEKGTAQFACTYKGATYYFVNDSHLQTFKKNPEKYEPQYGGWCAFAWGLKNGQKVEINPTTFKIANDKLYLFYNKGKNNTLLDWNKDESKLKSKADTNWNNQIK